MQIHSIPSHLDATRCEVAPPQGTPETLCSALASLTKNKHAIIVSGDLGRFSDPELAHTAAVATFQKVKATTPHLDPVVVIEGSTAGAERIFTLARDMDVPVIRLEPSMPDTAPRAGETIVCSGGFDDGDSAGNHSSAAQREALYSGIQIGAAAKSLLIFGNSEQIWATSLSAMGEGFNIVGLRNNLLAAGSDEAEVFRQAEISLRRNDVACHDIYASPFATEVERHVHGKIAVAFVTSEKSDYVSRAEVDDAMFVVGRKLGITSDIQSTDFVIVSRESAGADRVGGAMRYASEAGRSSLFVYSDDAIKAPRFNNENRHWINTTRFERNAGELRAGTACSEVLGIASQVNGGARQAMVIFGASWNGADDALIAVENGNLVIVLDDYLLQPAAADVDPKATEEYARFQARREELKAAGVLFYDDAESMPNNLLLWNGPTVSDAMETRIVSTSV